MKMLGHILTDKGSKYAVSGCPVTDRASVDAALKLLKREKAYAKATHNTWAVQLSATGALKGDDGESGAGMIIVRMLEREGLNDHLIVVTRWYEESIWVVIVSAMCRPVCAPIWMRCN